MIIKDEKEYKEYRNRLEVFIAKGTKLGSMELLPSEDLDEMDLLVEAIAEYEAAYHPLPGKISTLLTNAIREKMNEKGISQKEAAKLLGISESRMADLLNGRYKLNLNIAKRLRDNFGISADLILDCACV